MIAVTGATGKLGQLVIEELLKRTSAADIVAIVRNPQKAEGLKSIGVTVRKGDYDQPETWPAALQGVKSLLLISSTDIGRREEQHRVVVRAAKAAKIGLIAYTSVLRADTSVLGLAKEHLGTENAIKESGIPYVFLRNGWYLENHTENLAPALQFGALNGAAKDGVFSSATRQDYAAAAAVVLTGEGHSGKIYELGGDTGFTMNELAREVARQTGKSVSYHDHPFADFKKMLEGFGLPEALANLLADSDVGASKGALRTDAKDLSRLIGRPTTSLSVAVKKAVS